MSCLRLLACAFIGAVLLWAGSAQARTSGGRTLGAEFGLGADYLPDDDAGSFMGTVAVDTPIAQHLTMGGRFGLALESDPSRFAVPLDARLRFKLRRFYMDGLAGGWLFFKGEDHFRFHAGVGAGFLLSRTVRIGAELGYLDPSMMIGVRIAFAF